MKVSELIGYARSLANIASTASIGHDDEDKTINPSWKDLYGRLIDRDDDYFTSEQTFPSLTTYATSNPNEYKIPLPSDFYRLRFVDYQPALGITGTWTQMHKMPLSMRNDQPSEPHYRFDSTNLWVVGSNVTQVRIHYYPPPATLTHPDTDLIYGTSYAPGGASGFQLISSPCYCLPNNTMVYIYNLQNIVEESQTNNSVITPVTLLAAGANLSNLFYYKGYLYWIQTGDIKRAPTDLVTTPLVPAAVTANGNITSFSINYDAIYYTTTTDMRKCLLGGTGDSQLAMYVATSICADSLGGVYFSEGTTNHLHKLFVVNPLATNASKVTIDMNNVLYYLDTTNQIHQFTVDSGFLTVLSDYILRTDISSMGPWVGRLPTPGTPSPSNRIAVITKEGQQLLAVSSYADSDVSYPANIITEIMGVKAARDFCIKLGKDWGSLKEILGLTPEESPKNAATGLWATFYQLFRRDDYEPERIKNSRMQNSGMGML